jgi:hypothetical protein
VSAGVYVVLFDAPGSEERETLGPFEHAGVDSHVFTTRAGCRLFDHRGAEIARLGVKGWQVIAPDGVPRGVRYVVSQRRVGGPHRVRRRGERGRRLHGVPELRALAPTVRSADALGDQLCRT